jgi:hypothetical protein
MPRPEELGGAQISEVVRQCAVGEGTIACDLFRTYQPDGDSEVRIDLLHECKYSERVYLLCYLDSVKDAIDELFGITQLDCLGSLQHRGRGNAIAVKVGWIWER